MGTFEQYMQALDFSGLFEKTPGLNTSEFRKIVMMPLDLMATGIKMDGCKLDCSPMYVRYLIRHYRKCVTDVDFDVLTEHVKNTTSESTVSIKIDVWIHIDIGLLYNDKAALKKDGDWQTCQSIKIEDATSKPREYHPWQWHLENQSKFSCCEVGSSIQ